MTRLLTAIACLLILGLGLGAVARPGDDGPAPPESFSKDQAAHWAYQPIVRPELPVVKDAAWVRNPIDRFVRAATEDLGLSHARPADRVALIRRVTYDLTGLPPSPDEVFAFLADPTVDAYERVVDRLLKSPRYGERWAQHCSTWRITPTPTASSLTPSGPTPGGTATGSWRSFNADLPYDRFVACFNWPAMSSSPALSRRPDRHRLRSGWASRGRLGEHRSGQGQASVRVDRRSPGTVGSVFLGLTIGCARCHDHKFDADARRPTITRLQAFFAGG